MPQEDITFETEYLGITEAAEYLRVSASTLRRWEKKGFLVPERTPTGIRRYTKQQLDDVIQSPDGFSSSHPNQETHQKLQPHEELQASIQKQLEELDSSLATQSTPIQEYSSPDTEIPREEVVIHTPDNFNVIHNYPPYGITNLQPEQVYNAVPEAMKSSQPPNEHAYIEDENSETVKPTYQPHESFYSYNASKPPSDSYRYNEEQKDDTEDGSFASISVKNSEVFHHEYEMEPAIQEENEEYESDSALPERDEHTEPIKQSKKPLSLPPKLLWGSLIGVVILIVGVSVWILMSISGPTELISPLAQ